MRGHEESSETVEELVADYSVIEIDSLLKSGYPSFNEIL